ncbi:hypothetical protein MPSEU_000350300 [Mayamaea pseudoterrestris]|nr:hypothetical protein MPSEU_000350300 [Mayamaea pseudoterrestris]
MTTRHRNKDLINNTTTMDAIPDESPMPPDSSLVPAAARADATASAEARASTTVPAAARANSNAPTAFLPATVEEEEDDDNEEEEDEEEEDKDEEEEEEDYAGGQTEVPPHAEEHGIKKLRHLHAEKAAADNVAAGAQNIEAAAGTTLAAGATTNTFENRFPTSTVHVPVKGGDNSNSSYEEYLDIDEDVLNVLGHDDQWKQSCRDCESRRTTAVEEDDSYSLCTNGCFLE